MELFEGVLLNCIYLLFPFSFYLISNTYYKNIDEKTNNFFFEITLFSSLYLLFRYGKSISLIHPMIIFNIPLLIAYLKKRNIASIIISILLIIYYHYNLSLSYIFLVIEYAAYYFTYNYVIKSKKSSPVGIIIGFVVIKSFLLSFRTFLIYKPHAPIIYNFLEIFTTMFIFVIVSYFCLSLLNKAEEILDLNNTLYQLEKEKKLRNSLFKITHEIKNPIAVCKGYLDMIDYNDKEKVERFIPIIKDQIGRTLILMDDFLDYTKIKVNKEETDIYMLLEESCDVTLPLVKKANINLEFDIPDEELYMMIDYNRIKQVIVNILKNSIEAKDNRKKYKYISIKVVKGKNDIIIKIKDNGMGMDKKNLERVDEMFYTTKDNGTGLGVALSKEIIELHGGSIKYTSQKNKYTIVSIKLPYNKEEKA